METSTVLKQIIGNPANKPVSMPAGSVVGFLSHATILPAKPRSTESVNSKDKYDSDLLGELFVEMSCYYRRSLSDRSADKRLVRILDALANTLSQSSPGTVKRFFDSVGDEAECFWFMISTFTDYPNVDPAVFKDRLADTIKHTNQFTKAFKTALIRSKAGTLKSELQGAFTFSTLATKLAILDIWVERQELDEEWFYSLQQSADPILKKKIATLISPDE